MALTLPPKQSQDLDRSERLALWVLLVVAAGQWLILTSGVLPPTAMCVGWTQGLWMLRGIPQTMMLLTIAFLAQSGPRTEGRADIGQAVALLSMLVPSLLIAESVSGHHIELLRLLLTESGAEARCAAGSYPHAGSALAALAVGVLALLLRREGRWVRAIWPVCMTIGALLLAIGVYLYAGLQIGDERPAAEIHLSITSLVGLALLLSVAARRRRDLQPVAWFAAESHRSDVWEIVPVFVGVPLGQLLLRAAFLAAGLPAGQAHRFALLAVTLGVSATVFLVQGKRKAESRQRAVLASQYRMLAENSSDIVLQVGADGHLVWASESTSEALGRSAEDLIGASALHLVVPGDRMEMAAAMVPRVGTEPQVREVRLHRADGSQVWMAMTARSVIVDGESMIIASLRDIERAHALEVNMERQAKHDELTGLHNREWLTSSLALELARTPVTASGATLLLLDLDRFKRINASLGPTAGDAVLQELSRRLLAAAEPYGRIARVGGDEFAVLLPASSGLPNIDRFVLQLGAVLGEPIDIGGHELVVTASVGIATARSGATAQTLLRDAEAALHIAKMEGPGGSSHFEAAMHATALRRVTLEAEIRLGIANDEFVVHYQPIVDLQDEHVAGFEALLRWNHPKRGLLLPGEFLQAAEDAGLEPELGRRTLRVVCQQLARSPGFRGWMSVNISIAHLRQPDWDRTALGTLRRHNIDPRRLTLEITESAALLLSPENLQSLVRVRERGVGVVLDDFGTGFSSLAAIQQLPVTGLKLDRTFVAPLADDASSASAVAQAMLTLAQGMTLTGIAEGIETATQLGVLRGMGWRYGQGFLLGWPAMFPEHLFA